MAGSKTDQWANYINDISFGGGVFGVTHYIALSTAAFDATKLDDLAGFGELSVGGYGRLAVPDTKGMWSYSGIAIARTITNIVDFIFGAATADWPVVQSAYVCQAAAPNSGGMLMVGADLLSPTGVPTGRAFTIAVGDLAITER